MDTNKVYIKFNAPEDVYRFFPLYDLEREFNPSPPITCPKCGSSLYIPIEVDEGLRIVKPMGELYRPLPLELLDFVIRGLEEPTWLEYQDGDTYIEATIDGFSREPIPCEVCFPQSREVDDCCGVREREAVEET